MAVKQTEIIEAKAITVIDINNNRIRYENIKLEVSKDKLTIYQENICIVYVLENVTNFFYDIPPI